MPQMWSLRRSDCILSAMSKLARRSAGSFQRLHGQLRMQPLETQPDKRPPWPLSCYANLSTRMLHTLQVDTLPCTEPRWYLQS